MSEIDFDFTKPLPPEKELVMKDTLLLLCIIEEMGGKVPIAGVCLALDDDPHKSIARYQDARDFGSSFGMLEVVLPDKIKTTLKAKEVVKNLNHLSGGAIDRVRKFRQGRTK